MPLLDAVARRHVTRWFTRYAAACAVWLVAGLLLLVFNTLVN